MQVVPGDNIGTPPVWQEYKKIVAEAENKEVKDLLHYSNVGVSFLSIKHPC
jgi:hypothetical protein